MFLKHRADLFLLLWEITVLISIISPCLGNSQELTRLSCGVTKYLVRLSNGKFMLRKTGVSAWIPGNCYFHSFIHSFTHQTILEHCVGHSMVGFFPPSVQFSRLVVSDSATPWTAACQASLSITNSQSSLKPMSIESVMPSSHLILCSQALPASESFPMSQLFAWSGLSTGVSASASFLPKNTQDRSLKYHKKGESVTIKC